MLITDTIYKEIIGHIDRAISGFDRIETIDNELEYSDETRNDIKRLREEIVKAKFILNMYHDSYLEYYSPACLQETAVKICEVCTEFSILNGAKRSSDLIPNCLELIPKLVGKYLKDYAYDHCHNKDEMMEIVMRENLAAEELEEAKKHYEWCKERNIINLYKQGE